MSLQRDELAARCLVAGLHDPSRSAPASERAEFAVECADALLARLRPASGAPASDPRRTVGAVVRWRGQDHPDEEWLLVGNNKAVALKIRKPHLLHCGTNQDGGGDEFVRWATREECERHSIPYVARPLPGAPLAAPSPAASPAAWVPKAYVPKVGDKVEFDAVFTDNKSGVVVAVDEARQVASIVRFGEAPSKPKWERYFYDVRIIGVANDIERINAGLPATSSERAAAGLPVDETPAFDEAQEREAFAKWIVDTDEAGFDSVEWAGGYDPLGVVLEPAFSKNSLRMEWAAWLARARVAAKGGV